MAFENATRQQLKPLPQISYVAQGNQTVTLPRVGYLAKLYVHVNGTMTCTPGTGTCTLSERGPWNLLSRVRLKANTVTDIFNTTGYGAFLFDLLTNYRRTPDLTDRTVTALSAQVFQAGVASGANTWDFGFCIPVTLNERDMAGLIMLQMETMTSQLSIDFNAAGGATNDFPVVLTGNATASFSGNVFVELETFSLPANEADLPDIRNVHQILEVSQPIAGTGDNTINLMRANLYLRVLHYAIVNGALDGADIDRIQFKYNNAETPYDLTRMFLLQLARRRYGVDLPKGTFVLDFFYQGFPQYGGLRDVVAGGAVAELQSIVTVDTAASLGSGNNFVNTITEQIVPLTVPNAS